MANPNIQDFDDLTSAVAKYLKRQDLTSMIPDFVQFAENFFDNLPDLIQINARRRSYQATPTQTIFPAPSDMKKPIMAYMGGRLLDFFPMGWESQYAGGQVPQIANGYQIIGRNISLSVAQLGLIFQLDYYQTLEGLSETNESNWLLDDAPLAYLAGTLYEGFTYVRDYEKAEYWKSKRDELLLLYIQSDVSSRTPSTQLTIRAG